MATSFILFVLQFIILSNFAIGSEGDRCNQYKECVVSCSATHKVPAYLNLFWSVKADCQYHCMRKHHKERIAKGLKAVQYHGKWPFVRIFGIQEFASVLFSIGNFWAQVKGFKRAHWLIKDCAMYKYWRTAFILNLNGWVWSIIFHSRDTYVTEKLDYFSATALVFYSLYHTLVFFFKLDEKRTKRDKLAIAFILFYTFHLLKLLDHFDYGYNMLITASSGILFNIMWIAAYVLKQTKSKLSIVCALLFMSAGCLEISDFAPIGDLIDAHSLWHLSTIPITFFWWKFLSELSIEIPNIKTKN